MPFYLFLHVLGCSSKSSDTGSLELATDSINECPYSGMDADVYMFATASFQEDDKWYVEAATVSGLVSSIDVDFIPFDESQLVSSSLENQGQEEGRDVWSQTIFFSDVPELKEYNPYETYLIFWIRDQNGALIDCAVLGDIQ